MSELISFSRGEAAIAGQTGTEWEKEHGLPAHIYSAAQIRKNLKAFKKVFADNYPNGRVCFAAKACTHRETLKIVNEEGCGADVASYNEARCALEADIPPEMLDLNGNCKEDFLIKEAIHKGMNIVADSVEEFENICAIAEALNKKPKVLLRISGYELEDITSDSYFTSGLWTKFGVPLRDLPKFIGTIKNYPQIEFVGFHTHIGSQIAQQEPYLAVLGKMIEMCALLNSTGIQCKVLNLGGGFPVRYVEKDAWDYIVQRIRQGYLDAEAGDAKHVFVWHDGLAGFATETNAKIHLEKWTGERFYTPYPKEKMLEAVLKGQVQVNGKTVNAVKALQNIGSPLLTIEPGRSVVEDAGVTLAKVGIVRKVAYEHDLVAIELGVTSHCESLLEKPVRKWEIADEYDKKDAKPFEAFIGGNLCFSGDMISKYKVFMQRKPKRGEVLIIHDTGAYSSSLMSANSNSFPRPARVLVKEDGTKVVMKQRDSFEQIFS